MLERIDFEADKLSKEEYKSQHKALAEKLVVLQQQARNEQVGMVVLFEGWDGAGKGSRISDLVYYLDARATSVHVTTDISEDEIRYFNDLKSGVTGYYPYLQQFWKSLGEQGAITFYDRGWYTAASELLLDLRRDKKGAKSKVFTEIDQHLTARAFARSTEEFERVMSDNGYIVIKFFMHISKKAQKRRLRKLYDDPATKWRVSKKKLKNAERYDELYPLFDALLDNSDFDFCPWIIVNGEDKRQANITVLQTMIDAFEKKLGKEHAEELAADELSEIKTEIHSRFQIVDIVPQVDDIATDRTLSRDEYRVQLKREQKTLFELQQQLFQKRIPLMIMYEGWDAAGKGGNIKRVAQALDARAYTIFPSPAPTKPELLHPHLWRYWTRLPKAGHVGIYDRSWYGRVLVERVEGLATTEEWSRAYDEINAFEWDLDYWGTILIKFWVNVSQDVQLERFHERENNPEKRWKITEDDWRNREKYPDYKAAIDDMFRLTSTPHAPWIILESDDKLYARVKALKIINEAIMDRLRKIDQAYW